MPALLIFAAICALVVGRRTGNKQFQTLAMLFFLCAFMLLFVSLIAFSLLYAPSV